MLARPIPSRAGTMCLSRRLRRASSSAFPGARGVIGSRLDFVEPIEDSAKSQERIGPYLRAGIVLRLQAALPYCLRQFASEGVILGAEEPLGAGRRMRTLDLLDDLA